MGNKQENWFHEQLSYSSKRAATWRIVGQQMRVQSFEWIVIAWSEVAIRFCTFRRDQLTNRMLGMDTQAQEYISLEHFLTVETYLESYRAKPNRQYNHTLGRQPC